MSVKKTTESFIKEASELHEGRYSYEKTVYRGAKDKVVITCPIHGDFEQFPTNHLRPCGCPSCTGATIKSKRWGEHNSVAKSKFIEAANLKHNFKYKYEKVKWSGTKIKVTIECPLHGTFDQTPDHHLSGSGCPACARINTVEQRKSNTAEFIEKARKIHGDKYDYSNVVYLENEGKVEIICPEHGPFWQRASGHLQGKGCLLCSNNSPLTTEEFVARARATHGEKYNYSKTKYEGALKKVTVICPDHGEFQQLADAHASGAGCPNCATRISKAERNIFEMVKALAPDAVQSDRTILDGREIDILIPSLKIGIEFNGLIWHSTKFGKKRSYHQDKTDAAAKKDVRLIHIWEDEWRDKREWCEAFITRLCKGQSRKIYARKCEIKPVETKEARPFLDANHLQGFRPGTHLGMFYEDELVALSTHGVNPKGEVELIRWCVKLGTSVVGGFSKIMKLLPDNIISFCDTAKHDGAGYLASGWKLHSETVLMYHYTNGVERINRQRFQKHKLVKMKGATGETERELAASLGFYQIGGLRQMKFVK